MDNKTALPVTLSADPNARLPESYEAARAAIAVCARVDECKAWADKTAALAAYGRQAKDDTLVVYARRIQARALRRAGELLNLVPRGDVATRFGQRGDHSPDTVCDGKDGTVPPVTRTQAADVAGLSERQRKTALRVAQVPAEDFDYAVESQDPPTVSKLAVLGTQSRPQPTDKLVEVMPASHEELRESMAVIYAFFQYCDRTDPIRLALGTPVEIAHLTRKEIQVIDSWLDRFVSSLPP